MPKWLKVVLGILAVLVLTCGLFVAGGMYWFNSNKDKLKDLGDRAMNEGKAFGRTSDADGCVEEALKRLDAKSGLMDQVEHKVFLKACLGEAPPSAGLCDGVPRKGEIMKSATWALDECTRRKHAGNQDCGRVLQELQDACANE